MIGFDPSAGGHTLPSALECLERIFPAGEAKHLALFLDYDGTLTPIVDQPEQAELAPEMRELLQRLAGRCTVAVISGRDLQDVRQRVAIDTVYYAGNHGFDIQGPHGRCLEHQQALALLPALADAERILRERLAAVPGCQVERKRFSVAVHYRRVHEDAMDSVENAVDEVLEAHPKLRKAGGKKIYELQPDLDWDKGRAVDWLLKTLELSPENVLPLYLGDDITDEDVFWTLSHYGIGIRVGSGSDRPAYTRARYGLKNQGEVPLFFQALLARLETR